MRGNGLFLSGKENQSRSTVERVGLPELECDWAMGGALLDASDLIRLLSGCTRSSSVRSKRTMERDPVSGRVHRS